MALNSGFFEAELVNDQPDRVYGSEHFGSLFDGVITDGIFKNYGKAFEVTKGEPTDTGLKVYVGVGRAWFNKTWTLNSSAWPIDIQRPPASGYRNDAIVLEVDTTRSVRTNTIKVITGNVWDYPRADVPSLKREETVKQYLLAIVKVSSSSLITNDAMSIVDTRGLTGTYTYAAPYAKTVTPTDQTIESIINSLETSFESYQKKYQADFDDWMTSIEGQLGTLSNEQTVRLALMIGEIYKSDYISGEYPYVKEEGLYLSLNDNGDKPSIEINFGYASLPYAANSGAIQVFPQEKEYSLLYTFEGDGKTKTFTIQDTITSITQVTVNGFVMSPTISGSSFTFEEAPDIGAVIVATAKP